MCSRFWHLGVIAVFITAAQGYFDTNDASLSPLQYGNSSVGNHAQTGRDSSNSIGFSKASSLTSFVKRQMECDPGYIPCGIGEWCHPVGTICCSDGEHNCPDGDTCCLSTGQCADPGYACCENRQYTCPTGSTCCPTGELNCALEGGVCCGEGSCLAGEKCCDDDHCAPGSGVCCGDGWCNEGETCCGQGLGCAKEGYVCCEGQKYSCPQGDQCCQDDDGPYCGQPNCLPTLKFPHVPGLTDELQENTCKGLKAFLKKNGGINKFDWNGPGSRKTTAKQRRDSGCGGGLSCPPGQNCDEFPMAATKQGGAGATIMCVPAWLNGFYGYLWNTFLQGESSNYVNQVKFRIIVEGCDLTDLEVAKVKRTSGSNTNSIVLSSDNNGVTIFNGSWFGNGTQGNNVVFIPLSPDDSGTGTYSFNYSLGGGQEISSGWVTDEYGDPYETLGALQPGSSNTTTFQLQIADAGPVYFFGWTRAKDVQMDFVVQAPPPSSTMLASPTLPPTSATTAPIASSSTGAASDIYTENKLWLLSFLVALI